jgi:hypothetical protein
MTTEQLDELVSLAAAIVVAQAAYPAKKAASEAADVAYTNAQVILNARIVAGDDPDSADMRALITNRMATFIDSAAKSALMQSANNAVNAARGAFDEAFIAIAFP